MRDGQRFEIGSIVVTQGKISPEQQRWLNQDVKKGQLYLYEDEPISDVLALLAAEGGHLETALKRYKWYEDGNDDKAATALKALGLPSVNGEEPWESPVDTNGIVTRLIRPPLVGANLQPTLWEKAIQKSPDLLRGADLRGAGFGGCELQRINLHGAKLQGAKLECCNLFRANLRGANLRGANLRYANLYEADLSLTDVSGVDFDQDKNSDNVKHLNTVILTNAFYDATNPPENLPDTIKGKLLALDERSYTEAIRLQKNYQNALFSDNRDAFAAAEKELTDYLRTKAAEAAEKAASEAVDTRAKAALEGAATTGMATYHYWRANLQELSFTVTDGLPTTAAAPSGQPDVSLGSDDIDLGGLHGLQR
jgi:uncharacterized protein YjbI with pentapeptide repeats